VDLFAERHPGAAGGEQGAPDDAGHPRPVLVEYGADQQRADVRCDGGNGEHEVQAQLLLVAHADALQELLGGAAIPVDALPHEHGLEGGVAKDDAGGQETVDDGERDLQQPLGAEDLERAARLDEAGPVAHSLARDAPLARLGAGLGRDPVQRRLVVQHRREQALFCHRGRMRARHGGGSSFPLSATVGGAATRVYGWLRTERVKSFRERRRALGRSDGWRTMKRTSELKAGRDGGEEVEPVQVERCQKGRREKKKINGRY